MARRIIRLVMTVCAAALGFGLGYGVGVVPRLDPRSVGPALVELIPLPDHVPEHPGGLSFRFAMAHDVIHERFPRHGQAHYLERDRLTREALAKLGPEDPAAFPWLDDLAAGSERLGKSLEAVAIMRDKLDRQRRRGVVGRELYSTFANLGTFLIHAHFRSAMAGDAEAKARFREGVGFVRQSVEVNPEAHFGRERWQAAIAEFLLAAMDQPQLLLVHDCLGNRLDAEIATLLDRQNNWTSTGYGRPTAARFDSPQTRERVPRFFQENVNLEDPQLWPELHAIRDQITKVGAESGWETVAVPSHRVPVPFDEPVLGIIGMWRQGGGANPHFCLALGETMLRVGQRYLAWAAFERAGRMADRFWPDPALQESLREHCRKRQAEIERTLSTTPEISGQGGQWQVVSPPPSPRAIAELRSDFDRELALGQDYQRDYQAYESEKIAGGFSINDEHLLDPFHASRPSIATQPGPEEFFAGISDEKQAALGSERGLAFGTLGAGIAATLAAASIWLANWFARPAKSLDGRAGF